ncbi:MAG: VWA domain-containing protein [Phycisphaerae bacterium]|nr:VWA domain-containing protein [Phycisphaerae bacterium]
MTDPAEDTMPCRPNVSAHARPVTHRAGDASSGRIEDACACTLPWVISACFHLGVALVMLLVAAMVYDVRQSDPLAEQVYADVTRPETTSRTVFEDVRQSTIRQEARQDRRPVDRPEGDTEVEGDMTGRDRPDVPSVIGDEGGAGQPDGGLPDYGPPRPGGVGFMDVTLRADHVVYVIDRSGSMAGGGAFDTLRRKLVDSIADLHVGTRVAQDQYFHLIFFGPDEPVEHAPRRLVAATNAAKIEAGRFLYGLTPQGRTQVLPALKRAFEVFDAAPSDGRKLICLLSDGDFEGLGQTHNAYKGKTGNEAVLAWLSDHNVDRDGDGRRDVTIQAYLYRGDDPDAVSVMQTIGDEHGGFAHVRP